jgi:hypothetical protein
MSYVTESYIVNTEYKQLWDYANYITEGFLYEISKSDKSKKIKQKDVETKNIAGDGIAGDESVSTTIGSTVVPVVTTLEYSEIRDILGKGISYIFSFLLKNFSYLSVGVIGIVLSVLTYKIYKKYKDGKCSGLEGDAYTACQLAGINESIKVIKQSYNKCSNSKDPDACRIKLKNILEKWEEKKNKYRNG